MSQGREIDSRSQGDCTPSSLDAAEREPLCAPVSLKLSMESVLRAIAASAPEPWFPSSFASAAGIARDSLDEPLAELRQTGLAQISDWIRGQGQGYALTPAGEAAAREPSILSKLREGPPDLPPPALETLTGGTKTIAMEKPVEEWPISKTVELDLRPPMVTPALLIANLSWFIVGLLVAWRWEVPISRYLANGDHKLLLRMGAVDGGTLLQGEWWRLLSCCFVHIGLLHLLVNLFALIMTGPLAEVLWGRLRLTLIYLISGLAGSCLAMILQPVANGAVLILAGASGAIWGLMTSLLAWLLLNRDRLPPALVADWSRKLGLMFLLNIGVSFIPGVSWAGHLGGGLAGFISAGLVNAWRFGNPLRRTVAVVMLILLPTACILSLAAAMKSGAAWTSLRAVQAREIAREKWTKDRSEIFERDIIPKLDAIQPRVVKPLHDEIVLFVISGRQKVNAQARGAFDVQLDHLRTQAKDSLAFFKERPTGKYSLDLKILQAREFTRAQLAVLDHLRQLLDATQVPDEDEWKSLRFQREQAERFAEPLWKKPQGPILVPPIPALPAAPDLPAI